MVCSLTFHISTSILLLWLNKHSDMGEQVYFTYSITGKLKECN